MVMVLFDKKFLDYCQKEYVELNLDIYLSLGKD